MERDDRMYCTYCGNEIRPRLYLPGRCRRCKHELDWKPAWIPNVILLVSLLPPPLLAGLLRRYGLAWTVGGFAFGFVLTFVVFNLLEVLAWRVGLLKSDKVSNQPVEEPDHIKKPLSSLDYITRAQVELSRVKMPDLARTSDDASAGSANRKGDVQPPDTASKASPQDAPHGHRRCRFEHVRAGQTQKIEDLSRLATQIVREHFEPIIGAAQNEYMIGRFQTPEAIARQIDEGYEYCFVCPPGTTGTEPPEERRIGFLAFCRRGENELYLGKFYLRADQRGKGYSHDMLEFVKREASRLGCDHITLNVNRNNFQAILAYEHLGFRKIREEKNDIGSGYYMDDFVYELDL